MKRTPFILSLPLSTGEKMGNIKKTLSLFAIILMVASTLGYAGFSYFASSKGHSYRGKLELKPRSATYYKLLSDSNLKGTISSSSPIIVYILDDEGLEKLKTGESGTPYKFWKGQSIEINEKIPKGNYYLVIINTGYADTEVMISLENKR